MSYSISISGHHPRGAEGEQELHDELNAVLAKPEHGVSNSSFHGQHVHSNALHVHPEHATHTHEHHREHEGDSERDSD